MKHGWISLHRKLQDNELWYKEPFTRGQAWVDLLLLANHSKGFVVKHDKVIEIGRGQVGHSILDLSIRWKWSRTKVNSFLKLLQNMNQISVETRQRITSIISITNYDKYQAEKQREDNEKTTRRQREDINNNVNNVNKNKQLKNNVYFLAFWNAYPKKVGKQSAEKAYKKISQSEEQLNIILKAIEKQKRSIQWNKEDGQFIPNPTTWLNQGRWEDEIVTSKYLNSLQAWLLVEKFFNNESEKPTDRVIVKTMKQLWGHGEKLSRDKKPFIQRDFERLYTQNLKDLIEKEI